MTDLDAVALAVLGHPRRRLLGALVRHWLARPIPEVDDLPEREPTEPFLVWACRCACGPGAAGELEQVRQQADRLLASAARTGQRAVSIACPGYPRALGDIPDPPPVVWLRGRLEALQAARIVAVVGARAASRQGLEVAATIGAGLASAGVVVVSGLARGIDTAAHRAALDAGGLSVAVLGSGLDRVYPPEHARLADQLAERGAVISECVPGTPPLAFHFPLRNRLISGLAAATVVVEASEKSGSLITAGAALDQGREVMAVPGSVGHRPSPRRPCAAARWRHAGRDGGRCDGGARMVPTRGAGSSRRPPARPGAGRRTGPRSRHRRIRRRRRVGGNRLAAVTCLCQAGRPRDRRTHPAGGGGRFVGSAEPRANVGGSCLRGSPCRSP